MEYYDGDDLVQLIIKFLTLINFILYVYKLDYNAVNNGMISDITSKWHNLKVYVSS